MIRNGTTLPGRSPAHQEVVGALDQACAIWGLAGGDGRSRFIQHFLRYGLLLLHDAGVLEFPEAAEPEFVQDCREIEARLSAAGPPRSSPRPASVLQLGRWVAPVPTGQVPERGRPRHPG